MAGTATLENQEGVEGIALNYLGWSGVYCRVVCLRHTAVSSALDIYHGWEHLPVLKGLLCRLHVLLL